MNTPSFGLVKEVCYFNHRALAISEEQITISDSHSSYSFPVPKNLNLDALKSISIEEKDDKFSLTYWGQVGVIAKKISAIAIDFILTACKGDRVVVEYVTYPISGFFLNSKSHNIKT